ncbi:uncharacterized protein LOC114163434 [Vigna unguiculata]|uniref:uncharacterized protein LOC114163434 n=1 Tax=Vigna unguiculata TaxID=3917 RepID=UPI001016DD86|nr:uncharacterized protein LOC114163434 [Vigna unguiculata]
MLVSKFQSNPNEAHYETAKRILKYLKRKINVGLWYPGCKLDKKSTSGTCHLLGSSLISWNSKNQAYMSLSTTKAEDIAVGHGCAQIIWLKHQF